MFRLKISDVLTTNWNLASSKISNVGTRNTTGSSPRVSIKISTSVSTNTSGNSPDVLFQISVFGAINQQQRAGLLVVWSGLGAEVSAPPRWGSQLMYRKRECDWYYVLRTCEIYRTVCRNVQYQPLILATGLSVRHSYWCYSIWRINAKIITQQIDLNNRRRVGSETVVQAQSGCISAPHITAVQLCVVCVFPAVFWSLKEELSGQSRLSLVPTSLPPQCEAEPFDV